MSQTQPTKPRRPKSSSTFTTSTIVHACSHKQGFKTCTKSFSRPGDLRAHQKSHARPLHCQEFRCTSRFSSTKDLERHKIQVHVATVRYFCPYETCRNAMEHTTNEGIHRSGYRRKDHWLKHLNAEHQTTKDEMKAFRKAGIPTARLRGDSWVRVILGIVITEDDPRAEQEKEENGKKEEEEVRLKTSPSRYLPTWESFK